MSSHGAGKVRRCFSTRPKGLLHLHSMTPVMVHFDIKPGNILISADGVAKLSDVGLAKRLTATVTTSWGGCTPCYAAPEILLRRGANEKSDIYSFGLMIWQMYTTRRPDLGEETIVVSSWPIACLLKGSMAAGHRGALAEEKHQRPTTPQLKEELEKLVP